MPEFPTSVLVGDSAVLETVYESTDGGPAASERGSHEFVYVPHTFGQDMAGCPNMTGEKLPTTDLLSIAVSSATSSLRFRVSKVYV